MARFFINRPIVAIVIAIVMVIVGVVALLGLPISQYPNIVPPEIFVNTTYVGADAQTVEQSVATPIEQEMSGVDNMNYMYSLNANNGELKLYVNFDVKTDPNIDQVLTQMRESQAEAKLPADVRNYGVTIKKSTAAPLMVVNLISPEGHLRCHLPGQLRLYQLERPDHPGARHRQRYRLRGRPICHALLGQARPTGQAQHHHPGDRRRHPETEHRQSLGPGGRRAGPRRPGIHLRHPLPGTSGKSPGV